MRVIKFLFFIGLLAFINTQVALSKSSDITLNYKNLKDEMVRFHVIANSDSEFDQKVKNIIKDRVVKYLNENETLDGSKDEILNTLCKNSYYIKKIGEEVLKEFGVEQEINIKVGKKYFEDRIYEGYLIPEGVYDSFIMYIGEGKGKNFWSLLFSSVGFIHDNNKDKNINSMVEVINNNSKDMEVSTFGRQAKKNVKVSFKIVEVVKNIFQKIF